MSKWFKKGSKKNNRPRRYGAGRKNSRVEKHHREYNLFKESVRKQL